MSEFELVDGENLQVPASTTKRLKVEGGWIYEITTYIEGTRTQFDQKVNCVFVPNNLPRLDEKRKAEIAFEMMREFSEMTHDFSEGHEVADFVDWLNKKAKGEK